MAANQPTETVQELPPSWIFSSPYGVPDQPLLVAGDRLVGCYQNEVIYVVDLYSGTEVKQGGFPHRRGGDADSDVQMAVGGGRIFYIGDDGRLDALRLADGAVPPGWTSPAVGAATAIVASHDAVLVATRGPNGETLVSAFNTADGRPAWPTTKPAANMIAIGNGSIGAIAVGTDTIFFVADNRLYAVNTRFGDVRFPSPRGNAAAAPALPLDQTQRPLVTAGTVVCCGDAVYGFDVKTGMKRWSAPAAPSEKASWSAALSQDGARIAAVSSAGAVLLLDAETGRPVCSTTIPDGGTPVLAGDLIYVVAADKRRLHALRIDDRGKAITSLGLFSVGQDVADVGPVIGNGMVIVPTSDGNISAKPFTSVEAAHFAGSSSVTIAPDDAEAFAFGSGDFSVEGWVRSSQGGEILSSYAADTGQCGFRFNLTADGELRFAVVDGAEANADLAVGAPSAAAEGEWHHVAATRHDGVIALFVDGRSVRVATLWRRDGVAVHCNGRAVMPNGTPILDRLTPPLPPPPCNVGTRQTLTLGASVTGSGTTPSDGFNGLLRELRIWDVALDAAKLQGRMGKMLDPTVPHLRGNWHLNAATIVNDVAQHEFPASASGVNAVFTDLVIDDEAFPYHLEQVRMQWPYAGHWTVRGERPIAAAPVLSDDGVVCFATSDALYGVNASDGGRRWSIPTAGAVSPPIAFGNAFYATAHERGLIIIDAQTGAHAEVDGFQRMLVPANALLAAPANNGRLLAAATPDGTVWIRDAAGSQPARPFATAAEPGDLVIEGGKVYCVAGTNLGPKRLFMIDLATGDTQSVAVSSAVFAVSGDRIYSVRNGRLVLSTTSAIATVSGAAAAIPAPALTGLAVDRDANCLLAATSDGVLYGVSCATLGLAWQVAIPEGTAPSPHARRGWLNAPVIDRREVYCTSRSGVVAAVDGRNGQLRGLVHAATAVMTPALVRNGTAYFGCDDAPPMAPLDGALHSVVFGQTRVLRLGLDGEGRPGARPGHAKIERTDAHDAILLRDPGQCCVEAWVNTRTGGEILSIRPSRASGMGLRLGLTGSGAVMFSLLEAAPGGAWSELTARIEPTAACDGQWHHIAASCEGGDAVRIYLDGVAHQVTTHSSDAAPATLAPGLLALIGADVAQEAGTALPGFVGLIGEVRLWDTYLVAAEIGDRMHDKLRGDEPDLLAFWNFDAARVHDAARNGFDGVLEPDASDAAFWLGDLVFEHPSYPYFVTAAKIWQKGEADAAAGDVKGETIYELAISVRKADGSPLASEHLECWYVRHADIADPGTIRVGLADTTAPLTTLAGIAPNEPELPAQHSFRCVTDSAGNATLRVFTTDVAHGPSLDLRADFMPANERYHVNVLLDNQLLAKPVPPTLMAQSKLIQDYHWSTGAVINADRSRRTYRTIITALNPDRSPRPNERISIWATDHVDIEVNGVVSSVSPENNLVFYTDAEGEVTVVLAAETLNVPRLSVWAGFMDRNARYVIDPAQDAHDGLATIDSAQMSDDQRMTNWRSPAEGGPTHDSLLKGDYKPHAEKIAETVRHVMSATQRPDAPPNGGSQPVAGNALGIDATTRLAFTDMQQPAGIARADVIRSLPTMHHINRRSPITPQYMLASLRRAAPNSYGFVVSVGGGAGSFSMRHLTSREEALAVIGVPSPGRPAAERPLGSFFSDLWDEVKHIANTVADGFKSLAEHIKEIAVSVGEAITVALKTIDEKVIHVVVNAIEDAVDVIVTFIKKIALEIWQIIQFLMMLFDWDAIIRAHRIIREAALASIDILEQQLTRFDAAAERMLGSVASLFGVSLDGGSDAISQAPDDMVRAANRASAKAGSEVHSVGGKMLQAKVKEHGGDATVQLSSPTDEALDMGISMPETVEKLVKDMIGAASRLAHASPAQVGTILLDLLKDIGKDVLTESFRLAIDAIRMATALTRKILESLNASVDIPFISQLYKWITGDELSLLDLVCLVLGAAVHIAYGIAKGRPFADDAATIVDKIRTDHARRLAFSLDALPVAQAEAPAPLPWGQGDGVVREVFVVMLQSIRTVMGAATDALFLGTQGGIPELIPGFMSGLTFARAFCTMVKSITGVIVDTFKFLFATPFYLQQIATDLAAQGRTFELSNFILPYDDHVIIAYLASLGGDVWPLRGAWRSLGGTLAPSAGLSTSDEREWKFFCCWGFGMIGLIINEIIGMARGPQYADQVGRSIYAPSRHMSVADMLKHLASSFSICFTRKFFEEKGSANPEIYILCITLRLASNVTALALYSIAEFDYMRLPPA